MWDGDKPGTGTVQQTDVLQTRCWVKTASAQTAVVKHSEVKSQMDGCISMLREEESMVSGIVCGLQQILERGFLRREDAALEGALQLLRIANQDQILGGLRDGDDIGEGHLPGLVMKIRLCLEIFGWPKPRGSPTTLAAPD